MNSETEILEILKTAYEKEKKEKTFRERLSEFIYSSELYYMFIEEAFDSLVDGQETIESIVSHWTLIFCVHGNLLDKDSVYSIQIILWREVLYNVLAEISNEDEDE